MEIEYIGYTQPKEWDKLTGNSVESEVRMYIRYHGLTEQEARLLLTKQSYAERDELFAEMKLRVR